MRQAFEKIQGLRDDRGASIIEYSILVVAIAIVAVGAVASLGRETRTEYEAIAASFEVPTPGDGAVVPGTGDHADDPGGPNEGDPGIENPDATHPNDDNPGDNNDNPGSGDNPGGDSGDGNDNPGSGDGNDQPGAGEPQPASPDKVEANSGNSELYWWDEHGVRGEWVARIEFENDWIRHQYLTLEVKRTLANGKVVTEQVNGFYVPANGSATIEIWSNLLAERKNGKLTNDSVVEVTVTVKKITTSDENWQQVTYTTSGPSQSVEAPSTP